MVTIETQSPAHRQPAKSKPIVDTLIEERAPRLAGSPLWPILRPLLYQVLDYRKACRMAERIADMPGQAALDFVSEMLSLKVDVRGLEYVPRSGRVMIIANHPTGIADGVAVYDALRPLRPDIMFYANADAHRVCPQFGEVLIPVEWVDAKRTRDRTRTTLLMTRDAMEAERAIMVFPAGKLARKENGVLTDPEWMPTALSLARKYAAPILPIHMAGPWSTLFHLFHGFNTELRDITLFHELLNKRGRQFHLTVGAPIPWDRLDGDAVAASAQLKGWIERELQDRPGLAFA